MEATELEKSEIISPSALRVAKVLAHGLYWMYLYCDIWYANGLTSFAHIFYARLKDCRSCYDHVVIEGEYRNIENIHHSFERIPSGCKTER